MIISVIFVLLFLAFLMGIILVPKIDGNDLPMAEEITSVWKYTGARAAWCTAWMLRPV